MSSKKAFFESRKKGFISSQKKARGSTLATGDLCVVTNVFGTNSIRFTLYGADDLKVKRTFTITAPNLGGASTNLNRINGCAYNGDEIWIVVNGTSAFNHQIVGYNVSDDSLIIAFDCPVWNTLQSGNHKNVLTGVGLVDFEDTVNLYVSSGYNVLPHPDTGFATVTKTGALISTVITDPSGSAVEYNQVTKINGYSDFVWVITNRSSNSAQTKVQLRDTSGNVLNTSISKPTGSYVGVTGSTERLFVLSYNGVLPIYTIQELDPISFEIINESASLSGSGFVGLGGGYKRN